MTKASPIYRHVVHVTHEYFGPAADRFITRQVQNHLHKEPQELTSDDLSQLIDWIQVAVSLLSDDRFLIEAYISKLSAVTTKRTKGRS